MTSCSDDLRQSRFKDIVARHLDVAWRIARRCGVPSAQLDDVVQEVFIIVCRKLDEITVEREREFVAGATVRVAANWRRSLRRRLEDPLGEAEGPLERPFEAPQEESARRRQGLALLDAALGRMTEGQREVFVLTELEELTAREVGVHLGLPEAAVVSRLRRARGVFKGFCESWQGGQASSREPDPLAPTEVYDA